MTTASCQCRIGKPGTTPRTLLQGEYEVEVRSDRVLTATGVPSGPDKQLIDQYRRTGLVALQMESQGVILFEGDVSLQILPTDDGKRRYPPDGYYDANEQPGTPCTCTPECERPCKGQCGCEACTEAYGDYLSSRGD